MAVGTQEPDNDRLVQAAAGDDPLCIDGERRSPANKDAALKAIGKSVQRLGLTAEAVLAAAAGLLDGRLDAEAWRAWTPSDELRSIADPA